MSDLTTSLLTSLSDISSTLSSSNKQAESSSGTSFSDVLAEALSLAEDTSADSNEATLDLLTGNTDDLSSSLVTTEKAKIALSLTVAIRNKAIEAYNDVMSMQV